MRKFEDIRHILINAIEFEKALSMHPCITVTCVIINPKYQLLNHNRASLIIHNFLPVKVAPEEIFA